MTFAQAFFKFKWCMYHKAALGRCHRLHIGENLSQDELLWRQEKACREIVSFSLKNIPFYRKHYTDAGFGVCDIGKDGWFHGLPIVTKKELREHFDEFINPYYRRHLKVSTTGGSTGAPTKTGYDGRVPEEIYSWRLQKWFGVNPWDDHAYVWRDTRKTLFAKLKNAALWWPTHHLKLDATFITENSIREFLDRYNRLKPALLYGYVGAVTQVAQYVRDNRIAVHRPKFVWVTSAPLSPVQRKLIEQSFGAKVCDQYGSCEVRWIAAQCPECQGLHVNVEHVHIEFVDETNRPVEKGEYGRTLLTNLEDFAFPLIRYENGDRGRWLHDACPCGRTLPCIDSVKGREVESFILPSGRTINGEYLTTIFDSKPEVATNFRVIQHKDLSITVEYVPGAVEMPSDIEDGLKSAIGGEVEVNFRKVEAIQHDRGKLRFVVRER